MDNPKRTELQPHFPCYWLTPADDPDWDAEVRGICTLYREAPERAKQEQRVMSTERSYYSTD